MGHIPSCHAGAPDLEKRIDCGLMVSGEWAGRAGVHSAGDATMRLAPEPAFSAGPRSVELFILGYGTRAKVPERFQMTLWYVSPGPEFCLSLGCDWRRLGDRGK